MTMVKSYGANTYKNYGMGVKEPWALPAARSAWMDVGHSSMRWNATNDQFYRLKPPYHWAGSCQCDVSCSIAGRTSVCVRVGVLTLLFTESQGDAPVDTRWQVHDSQQAHTQATVVVLSNLMVSRSKFRH